MILSEVQKTRTALTYLGDEKKQDLSNLLNGGVVFPAVGSNSIRSKLYEFLKKNGCKQVFLIDDTAYVSPKTDLGESTLIGPMATVNSGTTIGKACIINTGAIIEHECTIGDFSHVAPGAVLAGNVIVGSKTFLGANCVVKQGITIGDNVTIGAGAVVVKDVPKGQTWVGNPAKKLK